MSMRILMLRPPADVRGPLPKLMPPLIAGLEELGASVTSEAWGGHRPDESIPTKILGRLRDIGRVRRILRRERFDVMVVATAHDWFTLLRDNGLLLVTRHRVRAVVQFHGSKSERLNEAGSRLFKRASARLLELSAGALVLSSEEQREWQAFCPSRPISVVSNPFVPPPASADVDEPWAHAPPAHRPVVLFVGRLLREKGIHVVVHALARVLRTTPAHLLVVGDGPERDAARALAARLGIEKSVTFTGYLSGRGLENAYRAGTVFVLPTTYPEGFPTVITEAMHAGLPIVTTSRRGIADHLSDGINALFVPPEDPDAVAAALGRLLADPALRERMQRANRQKIEEFRPRAVAERYLTVLRQMIGDGSRWQRPR